MNLSNSSLASLCSLHFIAFISELNNQHITEGDIGNAYLESYTNEKVYFMAGPKFGPLQGHNLIIINALYGYIPVAFVFTISLLTHFILWASLQVLPIMMSGCAHLLTPSNV